MSAEQRYDYTYEQFLQDSLPSLDLFGESTGIPTVDFSSYELLEDDMANLQQGGQSFFNDAYIFDQNQQFETPGDITDDFEFNTLAGSQPSALSTDGSALLDLATTVTGAEHLIFNAGDLQNGAFQTFTNAAGHSQYGFSEFEASQPATRDTDGVSASALKTPDMDMVQGAHLDVIPTGPIDNNESTAPHPYPAQSPDVDTDIEWSGPQKCHWRACASNATFRSLSSLKAHIRNVHVSPLVCTHPGCSYKKPFGKQCDLKRHITTIHSTKREYRCLESECQETFSRKDKMMKHAREKHELFRCSCNHCPATVCATQRQTHLEEAHGLFECAIGSCQSGGRSYFRKENLRRHLETVHGLRISLVDVVVRGLAYNAEEDEVLYIQEDQISALPRDCSSCLSSEAR